MNMNQALVFFGALSSGAVCFAAEYNDFSDVVSTRSRAEVVAERNLAHADHSRTMLEFGYPAVPVIPGSERSRKEVIAEYRTFHARVPGGYTDLNYPTTTALSTSGRAIVVMSHVTANR
jgi:hypothetical protein